MCEMMNKNEETQVAHHRPCLEEEDEEPISIPMLMILTWTSPVLGVLLHHYYMHYSESEIQNGPMDG